MMMSHIGKHTKHSNTCKIALLHHSTALTGDASLGPVGAREDVEGHAAERAGLGVLRHDLPAQLPRRAEG